MAVNPLTNRPVPANSDFARAMFAWVTATASQDPLDTDNDQQAMINFCGTYGCNVIFLDIWRYLGGANWTSAKRNRVHLFLDACHKSGIRVYALAGDVGWGTNHQWVFKNIVEPVLACNAMGVDSSKTFDGFIFDIEYWTDEGSYPASTHVPGVCDLVRAVKQASNLPVGLFCTFWLKDNTDDRPSVSYNGKNAQDGEHFMDVADFVVVGAYRDTAAAQAPLFQPWYDYASASGRNFGLYLGSETINISPANITYFGASKATMEAEHTSLSGTFKATTNASYLGIAVHSYDGWKAMT